ncbi:GAF domain-containing protein [Aquibium sp. A9E412]|uniref:sensor histidine kinase n=1 Tax=Aquibium sp. A9E412 TaxID=2976767 RepID=UPI0025AFC318|nr:HWE histidine kinase domain-containing protein [Aquibium sp. A9E412]MDN2565106.1 GAF domain-containing protein [Aquibium sp. A9E412]
MAGDGKAGRTLRDSAALLEGLRLGGVGVWRWKVDGDVLMWSDNLAGIHALPATAFDGTLSSFRNDIHPDDLEPVWRAIEHTLSTGAPYRSVYRTAPRDGAEPLWIETSGGLATGEDGATYLTGVCTDVTQRVRAERELKRRLAQQDAIAHVGSFALGEEDFQAIAQRAVEVAAEVLDVPLTKILQFADSADHLDLSAGVGWREGLVGHATVGIERESQAGFTLLDGGPVIVEDLATETRFDGPQLLHEHGVVSGISVVIAGEGPRPFGVFGIHSTVPRQFDQTDADFLTALANIVANAARQIAAVEHRTLLVREMAHRAGNMLQLVNTLARQTFRPGVDVDIARDVFAERLGSLSRANYLIAKGGWSRTRFRALAAETLAPFGGRARMSGRDVLLPPELCFDLGLVLHELSTNSAKYGSLAREEGTIFLTWRVEPDGDGAHSFHLEWFDPLRGPSGPGRGTGFGTKLVRLLVERKWSGTIAPAAESGYRLAFSIPLSGPVEGALPQVDAPSVETEVAGE